MVPSSLHLPDWLYESLPAAYFTIGLMVMLSLDNNWAVFSGVMLIFTSVFVVQVRRSYRKTPRESEVKDEDDIEAQSQMVGTMPIQLVWNRSFESGNSGIDAQHKGLFEVGNLLINAIYDKKPHREVLSMVDFLLEEMKSHFESEDTLLVSWDHPLAEEHRLEHLRLLVKGVEIRDQLEERDISYRAAFNFFINELILQHIVKEDKKFFYQV